MTAASAASAERDRSAGDLVRRARSAGLFVVVFLGAILAGPWTFAALLVLVSALGAIELARVVDHLGWGRGRFWIFLAPVGTLAIPLRIPAERLGPAVVLLLGVALVWLAWPRSPVGLERAQRSAEAARLAAWGQLPGFVGALYLSLLPSFLLRLHAGPWPGDDVGGSARAVLFIVLLVWAADTGAYGAGLRWGRHLLWAAVSPKKTWEGAIGGALTTILAAVTLGPVLRLGLSLPECLGAGLLVAVFAPLGDLFESRLKREAGVKDSGRILPGHGGILDRFDSLFFCAPVFYYYLRATGL